MGKKRRVPDLRQTPVREFRAASKIKPPNIARVMADDSAFILDLGGLRGRLATEAQRRRMGEALGRASLHWRAVNSPGSLQDFLHRLYRAQAQENARRAMDGQKRLSLSDLPVYVHENGQCVRLRDRLIRSWTYERDMRDLSRQIEARLDDRRAFLIQAMRDNPACRQAEFLARAWEATPDPTYIVSIDFSHKEDLLTRMPAGEWQSPPARLGSRDAVLSLDAGERGWLDRLLVTQHGKVFVVATFDERAFGLARKTAGPGALLKLPVNVSADGVLPRSDNIFDRARQPVMRGDSRSGHLFAHGHR